MISIIVAVARGGVIGQGNRLIWHISEDLRRFKSITSGHPVVMGRKTWESLGRPLAGRHNVVITRQEDFAGSGCTVAHNLENALALFEPSQEVFIIGGAQIYAQAMPLADRLYLTEVEADFEGDTHFPSWNRNEWSLREKKEYLRGEKFEHPFRFLVFERLK